MQKTITIFTVTQIETNVSISFSTNKQAQDAKNILATFGIESEISKTKKTIEL